MRRILVVSVIIAIAVVGFLAWQWVSRPDATRLRASDVPGTVILIPGYGGGSDGLRGLADFLQAQGRTVVIADIGDGHADIAGYGAQVAAMATAALAQGAPSVDLVGYSMGGLVARSAAERVPDAVRRVATIASPHAGTRVAGLGALLGNASTCPASCEQMAPGSDFLSALPVADGPDRWLSAWSAADDVVQPADSSTLPGATEIEVDAACSTGSLDHGGIVRSPVVWDLVGTFLQSGRVSASCSR